MILTTTIINIIFLSVAVIGITKSKHDWAVGMIICGIFLMILTSIIGYGVMPSKTETFTVNKLKVVEITRSSTKVFVDVDGWSTRTYVTKEDYDNIDSTFTIYEITYYNYYGDKNMNYVSQDKIYKKYDDNKKHLYKLIEN